jgi:hypothetical protein
LVLIDMGNSILFIGGAGVVRMPLGRRQSESGSKPASDKDSIDNTVT